MIATSLGTGSGGTEDTLYFAGLQDIAGTADTVRFTNPLNASPNDQRDALLRFLKLGLARYAVRIADGQHLNVTYESPANAASSPALAAARSDPLACVGIQRVSWGVRQRREPLGKQERLWGFQCATNC